MSEVAKHPLITEPVEKWLTALESGKYKQCRGELFDDGSYCCLGVAAKVISSNRMQSNTLTHDAVDWIRASGIPLKNSGMDRCVDMNDTEKKSFQEIAEAIRAHPEWFFEAKS